MTGRAAAGTRYASSRVGERDRANRTRIAIFAAAAHWALLLAIQIADFRGYHDAATGDRSFLSLVAALPLIQAQNVIVAAILGLLAYFASRNRIGSWLYFLFYLAISAGLVLDQVYYKVFLDHFHLGMIEGGQQFNPVILWDSFTDEADWIAGVSAVVGIAGCIWLAAAMWGHARAPISIRSVVAIFAVFGAAGIPKFAAQSYGHINEHPLVALARELQQRSVAEIVARRARSQIHLPIRSLDPSIDRDLRLASLLKAAHPRNPRPNLVLIVMESVGAVDLLGPDGLPTEKFTPQLAKLARSGVTFGSIYTTFPGTTRSLISLHTGGRQPTSGYMDELEPQFGAPLLARYLEKMGYATALFSSERLDGEATDIFLEKAGYQRFYDFSRDSAENRKKQELDSWGGREEYTLGLIEDWISHARPVSPFFLEYMTVATHHPYAVPSGYRGPATPQDRHSEYLNALSYSDQAIGSLMEFLSAQNLLNNTIVAVTGDHGEAFGDLHPNNLLHKNFIYDENVRDFLLLWDGQRNAGGLTKDPMVSSRAGTNGDIMPTLLAMLDLPRADVPGRNLFEESFSTQPVFFHKIAPPEMMGLRDGRWKFIYDIRSNRAELYDLAADPTEQKNVAAAHGNLVEQYREMCQQWYLGSEHEFVSYLGKRPRSGSPGARTLTIGYWQRRDDPSSFIKARTIPEGQHTVVLTEWAGDLDPSAMYAWTSPSGQTFFSRPLNAKAPHVTYSPFQGQDPMEPGKWSVQLRIGGKFPLAAHFGVMAAKAPAK